MSLARALPWSVYAFLEYVAVVVLVAAPFVLGFNDEVIPTLTCLGFAVVLGLVALVTRSPLALRPVLKPAVHAVLAYVLAVALVVAPFVLGFNDLTDPTVLLVVTGLVLLVLTLVTAFPDRTAGSRA